MIMPVRNIECACAPVSLDFAFLAGIVDVARPNFGCAIGGFQMAANPVAPNSELELSTQSKGTEAVVHASGRITAATSAQLQSTIRALFPDSKHVVLDLK